MIGLDRPGQPRVRPVEFRRSALASENLPSVSFVKATAFENGHPSNSDPIDEQHFVAENSTRSSSPSSGRARLSSSPTTIPTAGTTTSCRRSSARRNRRWMQSAAPANAVIPEHQHGAAQPLRLRAEAAVAADLALLEAELRRQHPDGPDLDPEVHRGQLVAWPDRLELDGQQSGLADEHVRIRLGRNAGAEGVPEHRDRRGDGRLRR